MSESLIREVLIGVALFDEPTAVLGGWYAYGDNSAVRFSAPQDLPQSVQYNGRGNPIIWITNADFTVYRDKLQGIGYLRLYKFFSPNLYKITPELGMDMNVTDRRTVVTTLAKVVHRAWKFACKAWPGIAPLEDMNESILAHLNVKDIPDIALLDPVMESGFQDSSSVIGQKYEVDAMILRLVPNRVRHATDVLSYGMPAGEWRVRRDINSVEQAMSLEQPSFLECDITWKGAPLADLCAYGAQAFGKNVSLRQWVAQPELLFLAEHATDIKVTAATVWDDLEMAPQLPDLFYEDSLTPLSYSVGIIAANFMEAISSRRYSRKHRKNFHPVRATWLRAVDRAISFSSAKLLTDSGLRIRQYGDGEVSVNVFRHELEDAVAIAADCGFMLATNPWRNK